MNELSSHTWMCEPRHLQAFADAVTACGAESIQQINDPAAVQAAGKREPEAVGVPAMTLAGATATVRVRGVLLQSVPKWLKKYVAAGYVNVTGLDEIAAAVQAAAADAQVERIVLDVASPGGDAAGTMEAALAVAEAARIKPVTAKVTTLAASAAYYIASQATTIESSADAEIGSIGTFAVFADYTGLDEKLGIKMIVIRSGEYKGMGYDGITDEQIRMYQGLIDGLAGQFADAVAAGRGMKKSEIKKLATGQVWLAPEAVRLGLADTVTSGTFTMTKERKQQMSEKETQQSAELDQQLQQARQAGQQAAADRLAALNEAFADNPKYAMEQFLAGADVTAAKAAYADVLAEQNRQLKQQNQELTEQVQQAAAKKTAGGAEPMAHSGTETGGDADGTAMGYRDYVRQYMADGLSKAAAVAKTVRLHPEAHAAHLASRTVGVQ
jgi:signal peptide peptidase SppA